MPDDIPAPVQAVPRPMGWLKGWLVTMLVSNTIACYVGSAVVFASYAILRSDAGAALLSFVQAVAFLLLFPFMLVATILPSTALYSLMRLAASRMRVTVAHRFAAGVVLGMLTIEVGNWLLSVHVFGAARDVYVLELWYRATPACLGIELSAITLALVARPRWFGVAHVSAA